MEPVLVVNAGSSSLKFSLFFRDAHDLSQRLKGQIEGIGVRPRFCVKNGEETMVDTILDIDRVANQASAIRVAAEWLRRELQVEPVAVGHRVVHGGAEFNQPVRITTSILEKLCQLEFLAPLHQPYNLAVVRSLLVSFPDLPQIACFDTAFHRTHNVLADWYALPRSLHEAGVRRYGFHGLSYEFVSGRLRELDGDVAFGRTIIAHLGSGASMCALKNGNSVESTMGFSSLDGLPMGTRPGQLDPGIVLYLINQKRMKPGQVEEFLYKECGLKGLSGVSSDVRDLTRSPEPTAEFALDYFSYRAAMTVGAFVSVLGGLDGFVFTAGIGENSPEMRKRIVDRLGWLGMWLDEEKNRTGETLISSRESAVKIMIVPTNEELVIARHTYDALDRCK